MRLAIAVLLELVLLTSCGMATPPSVRQITDMDFSVFSCSPNPTHRFIGSEADLTEVLSQLAPHCPAAVFEQRKAAFLRDLHRARFDWTEEVLVIAQDWYGTGMAKPSIVFAGPSDRLLTATIHWKVPPPPVTPDTASCRFAFAAKRSAATKIKVVGQNSGTLTFEVIR